VELLASFCLCFLKKPSARTGFMERLLNYHAVPGNLIRLGGFRSAVCRLWRQALKRRSQRNRLQRSRFGRLADIYIPKPRTAHPYPEERFASRT
jgi:hypothetical protein